MKINKNNVNLINLDNENYLLFYPNFNVINKVVYVVNNMRELNSTIIFENLEKINIIIPFSKKYKLSTIFKRYSNINYKLYKLRPTYNNLGMGIGRFISEKNEIILLFEPLETFWPRLIHELMHFYNKQRYLNSSPKELYGFNINNENFSKIDEYLANRKTIDYINDEDMKERVQNVRNNNPDYEKIYNNWFI